MIFSERKIHLRSEGRICRRSRRSARSSAPPWLPRPSSAPPSSRRSSSAAATTGSASARQRLPLAFCKKTIVNLLGKLLLVLCFDEIYTAEGFALGTPTWRGITEFLSVLLFFCQVLFVAGYILVHFRLYRLRFLHVAIHVAAFFEIEFK